MKKAMLNIDSEIERNDSAYKCPQYGKKSETGPNRAPMRSSPRQPQWSAAATAHDIDR
jgi:hypothetical protein